MQVVAGLDVHALGGDAHAALRCKHAAGDLAVLTAGFDLYVAAQGGDGAALQGHALLALLAATAALAQKGFVEGHAAKEAGLLLAVELEGAGAALGGIDRQVAAGLEHRAGLANDGGAAQVHVATRLQPDSLAVDDGALGLVEFAAAAVFELGLAKAVRWHKAPTAGLRVVLHAAGVIDGLDVKVLPSLDLRLAASRADVGAGKQGVAIGVRQHVALRLHAADQGDAALCAVAAAARSDVDDAKQAFAGLAAVLRQALVVRGQVVDVAPGQHHCGAAAGLDVGGRQGDVTLGLDAHFAGVNLAGLHSGALAHVVGDGGLLDQPAAAGLGAPVVIAVAGAGVHGDGPAGQQSGGATAGQVEVIERKAAVLVAIGLQRDGVASDGAGMRVDARVLVAQSDKPLHRALIAFETQTDADDFSCETTNCAMSASMELPDKYASIALPT